jgi:hypothetical protein
MRALMVSLMLAALAGCGASDAPPRDYVRTLYDQQQPVLEAEVTYLGKTAPPGAVVAHDWHQLDTDFYRTTLRNRSGYTLELLSLRYAMAKGPLFSPAVKDRAAIAADCGSATLRPGDVVRDEDSYVWAREDSNVLKRTVSLRMDGRTLTLELPLRYQR